MSDNMEIVEEDDNISITSTVLSEQKSEYDVECILTELKFPDGVKYLVKWDGYPVERATWEPPDSFSDPQTLKDWKAKKKAISRGQEEPFDLEGWEIRLEALEDARDERKRKRRAKRIRLGLPVSETEATEDENDTSSSEDIPFSGIRRRNSHRNIPSSPDSSALGSGPLEPRITASAGLPDNREPLSDSVQEVRTTSTAHIDTNKENISSNIQNSGTMALHSVLPPSVMAPTTASHREKPSSNATPQQSKSTHTNVPLLLPRGPARDQRSLGGSLHARKQRLKAQGNTSKEQPTLFRKLSTKRKYEKASRFEPAPDITKLDLRRPSDWAASSSGLNLDTLRPIRREESSELFVRQDTPKPTSPRPDTMLREDHLPEKPPAPPRSFSTGTVPHLGQHPVTQPDPSRLHVRRNTTFSAESAPRLGQHPVTSADTSEPPLQIDPATSLDDPMNSSLKRPQDAPSESTYPSVPPPQKLPPRRPKGAPQQASEVEVRLFYGPEKTRVGSVAICGLNELTKFKITSSSKTREGGFELWLQHLCTLDQYYHLCSRLSKNMKFCNGWIEGYSYNVPRIAELAKTLRDGNLVGICYLESVGVQNVLLVYATESREWEFLNGKEYVRPNVSLRVAARGPLPPISELRNLPVIEPSARSHPALLAEEQSPATATTHSGPPIHDKPCPPALNVVTSELGGNTAQSTMGLSESASRSPQNTGSALTAHPQSTEDIEMKDVSMAENLIDLDAILSQYDITFRNLATVNGSKSKTLAQVFYIWYPESAEAEYQVLVEFLKRHKVVTYSNRLPEDWERFARTVSHGVVIFHGDFLNFHDLPYFLDLTRKEINFWSVSLAAPLPYAERPTHLQRIFPHGGVILLTEDLFLYDQDCVVVILAWFEDYVRRRTPGSWKIMFRPDILNWLLKKAGEFETKSMEERKKARWLDMYCLILKLLPRHYHYHHDPRNPPHIEGGREEDGTYNPVISFRSIPNYGHRQEDECAAIPKGLRQDQRDTDHLVEFFAGWSIVNSHKFRRFIVASHYTQERWKAWNHLELRQGGRDFMKSQSIDANAIWAQLVSNTPRKSSSDPSRTDRTPRTPAVPSSSKWGTGNTPGTVATPSAQGVPSQLQRRPSATHQTPSLTHKYPDPYI
ncbi:hypothetical protein Plec18170_008267 [Paecilomyces lecythidis]